MTTVLQFTSNGAGRGLYTEAIPLESLGALDITRASTVEFSSRWQHWEVKIPGDRITVLYASPSRQECLAWERETFNQEVLNQ